MSERTFDWRPVHDPESRRYPIRSVLYADLPRTFVFWPVGPTLDQRAEGACVGHGWAHEATSEPVSVHFQKIDLGVDDQGNPWPRDAQEFAFALYYWCRRNDQWPGEDYEGTSVLAGAKGMKMLGLIPEYRWAFSPGDLVDTLVSPNGGPVVLGLNWYSGMYDAPDGELTVSGDLVGGHCLLAVGYDPDHYWSDGTSGEAVALFNSWGYGWGNGGVAWIRLEELAALLAENGEMCVPMERAYGPVDPEDEVEEPAVDPEPVEPPSARSLWDLLWSWLARLLTGPR